MTPALVRRAVAFALSRHIPFSTAEFVRAVYGEPPEGMSPQLLRCRLNAATRLMKRAAITLQATEGGRWFTYDKTSRKWRARVSTNTKRAR